MASSTEETIKRINNLKSVQGTIIVNDEGFPEVSTMDSLTSVKYTQTMKQLAYKARCVVRDLDPMDEVKFMRVKTKTCEIFVKPDPEFHLIVIQNTKSLKR